MGRGSKESLLICAILWDKSKYFKKNFIYPSQKKWKEWLTNQGGLERSVRQICRYFRRAENSMQIIRIRRLRHDHVKGMIFQTTLYRLAFLGLKLLWLNGIITHDELKEYLRNRSPFEARRPKKEKKGITPADKGFYKDFTTYGSPQREPI